MDWKQNMIAMLRLNLVFFLWSIIILMIQGSIPIWNPVKIVSMEATLAYNTATSFISNTNLQHYSGETGLSYFSQLLVIGFLQFVSAAIGIAALALLFKGIAQKKATDLGNFYNLFLKSCHKNFSSSFICSCYYLFIEWNASDFQWVTESAYT